MPRQTGWGAPVPGERYLVPQVLNLGVDAAATVWVGIWTTQMVYQHRRRALRRCRRDAVAVGDYGTEEG